MEFGEGSFAWFSAVLFVISLTVQMHNCSKFARVRTRCCVYSIVLHVAAGALGLVSKNTFSHHMYVFSSLYEHDTQHITSIDIIVVLKETEQ